MLHEFLLSNRDELIRRCKAKVRDRDASRATSPELERGVPLFLRQLDEALQRRAGASMESSRTAALHGKQSQEEGHTVDQVVHDYGDICQAITELAREKNASITVDEFQILNSLLDNAIADAVSAYERNRDSSISAQGDPDLHQRMGALAEEQRRHLDTALKALGALKLGNIGLMGATGTLLEDSLISLRDLIEKSLPELRLSTGMTKPPKP
jgi:hypothetical protein